MAKRSGGATPSGKDRLWTAYEEAAELEPNPIEVLGQKGRSVFYRSASGELIALLDRHHKAEALEKLFGGRIDWLKHAFPGDLDRDGVPRGYSAKVLRSWCFQEAEAAGFFDPNHDLRGPGVWRADDEDLILHCGDAVRIGGTWEPAGRRVGRIFYPAGRPLPRPAETPASASVGKERIVCSPRRMAGWSRLRSGSSEDS